MKRPPDHDDPHDIAGNSAAMDDEAHIAAHELGHDTAVVPAPASVWLPPAIYHHVRVRLWGCSQRHDARRPYATSEDDDNGAHHLSEVRGGR